MFLGGASGPCIPGALRAKGWEDGPHHGVDCVGILNAGVLSPDGDPIIIKVMALIF